MENFAYHIPTDVYFGKGQIVSLPARMKSYGKKVLLVYGSGSIHSNGLYDQIMDLMKENSFEVQELSGVEPNPRIQTVSRGVKICREHGINMVLAAGGGSVIDCAKAIACGVYYTQENKELWDMVMHPETISRALPLFVIATMAASGSEMDDTAVISNPEIRRKKGFKTEHAFAKVSVLDPCYTFSVPASQTAAGGADIMSHVMENYFQTPSVEITDGISEQLLRTVIKNLPIALKNPADYEARASLLWASELAINGMSQYGKRKAWSCHAMEHELSAYYDITHGTGLAILTPRWMEHILSENTVDKFDAFARNVWGLQESNPYIQAKKGIQKLQSFFADCGIPTHLSQLNIDDSQLEIMAAETVQHSHLGNAYVPLNEKDVLEIFRASL